MTSSPNVLFTIVSFILVIGPLVFVHEMGHYWVARWCGVHSETFSIGFGPELTSWTDKRGTRWRVGALPLGGYVRFTGDIGVASEMDPAWLELSPRERARCFPAKPVWQRALIVLAGPVVNLLFAALILAGFAVAYGQDVTPARVSDVTAGSAAAKAGILPGDEILAINGKRIERFDQLARAVMPAAGERKELHVRRDGELIDLAVVVGTHVERDRFGNEYRYGQLGVRSVAPVVRSVSLLEAPVVGLKRTAAMLGVVTDGFVQIITGRLPFSELGGPISTAKAAGEQASLGLNYFFYFVAFVSINLGFINLLPIPMLDGGHLLFYAIEAIQRRPVSPRIQEIAFRSGLLFLIGLMLMVTFMNDLTSLGLWRGLSRLIG